VVGNEVLLRGEMTGEALAATIRGVKTQVPMPVTYADVWEFWLRHPEVQAAVDFVTIHILPYWEDFPISARDAGPHVDAIRAQVAKRFPDKEILIGETGWPSAGRMREGALPSPSNQARVIHDVLAAAKRGNYRVNVIEAFDQPWKRALEGTVGGHWGFFDNATRDFKFKWGAPVSSHPYWIWQALGGIAFAGLIFSIAFRRREAEGPVWLAVNAIAVVSGVTLGWAIENASFESFGAGGIARSTALIVLALAAPLLATAALTWHRALPQFSMILSEGVQHDRLGRALGWTLIAVTVLSLMTALGLAFDPRYRDFPFAPLSCAIVPLFIVALLNPKSQVREVAETIAAAVLVLCAAFMVWNETLENWQALWLAGLFVLLALTLMPGRAARS